MAQVLQKFVPGSHAALAASVYTRCCWVGYHKRVAYFSVSQ